MLRKLVRNVIARFQRDRRDAEMAEEIRLHLEMQAEANRAAGMSPDEAHYAALRQFGHVDGIKERCRDRWGGAWLAQIGQDLRHGVRMLRKEKSTCALAIFVLALGIGSVTTAYSVINGMVVRGFSSPHADRLADLRYVNRATGQSGMLFALDYEELKTRQTSFEALAGHLSGNWTVNLTVEGNPLRCDGAYVTPEFFRILGVAPVFGRDFTPADDQPGVARVAIISHQLWQSAFGAASDILGKYVRLNGRATTIVGVMPPGFSFPYNEQIWIPLHSEYPSPRRNDLLAIGRQISVLGLLKPGVGCEQATAELTTFARQCAVAWPETNQNYDTALVQPIVRVLVWDLMRNLMWTLFAFTAGILFIACFNVLNLQFARATLRARELAVRSALGASRGRLIRQMLTESLLLALLGAGLGIALAVGGTQYLDTALHHSPYPLPAYITFDLDRSVLGFAVLATLLTAVIAGLLPAWMASRANACDAFKDSGRGHTGRVFGLVSRGLVVTQIFVTCVVLIGALLQVQTIVRQQRLDYGYDTNAVLTGVIYLMKGDYPTPASRQLFYERVLRQWRANPAIAGAALTSRSRMINGRIGAIEIEGNKYALDRDRPVTNREQISDGYFAALGVKLLAGRDFLPDDHEGKLPVAIVNAAFAEKHFGRTEALGRRFRTVDDSGRIFGPWRTIVGVVATMRMAGPFDDVAADGFYIPYADTVNGPASAQPSPRQVATFIVRPRETTDPHRVLPVVRRELQSIDPHLPIFFVRTPREQNDAWLVDRRTFSVVFMFFGVLAIVLAAAGLYGVMAFSVNQRTQEFGIRLALGADRRHILLQVLRQGAGQLALGLGLGLGMALIVSYVAHTTIQGYLFQTSPSDPLTYFGVALLLSVVAFVASFIPAHRATRVDPLTALRSD